MKKSNAMLQLQELPGKQWIALEGSDLAKSKKGFYGMRIEVTIAFADNLTIDEFSLAKKARMLLEGLMAANGGEPLRMMAVVCLRYTKEAVPTTWELAILADVPHAICKDVFNEQAAMYLKPCKIASCSFPTEVGVLLNRTWVVPSLHSSILAREFVCIREVVKDANDLLVDVERNRRRMRMRAKMS